MPKHVPLRKCIGCGQIKPKREMIRIVRTPEEEILVDPTGKRSGRGAYICPRLECMETGLRGKRLPEALKRPLSRELMEEIRAALHREIQRVQREEVTR